MYHQPLMLQLLIGLSVLLSCRGVSCELSPALRRLAAFVMDNHLKKGRSQMVRGHSVADVIEGLKAVAREHRGLESVDELAERFKSSSRRRTFLWKRLEGHRKYRKQDMKEAAKLSEYIGVVERSLQAAELLEAARGSGAAPSSSGKLHRDILLQEAGVREIFRVPNISWGKVSVVMSIMVPLGSSLPGRFKENEAIVAFFDSSNESLVSPALLNFLDERPCLVTSPGSLIQEKITVHRGVLQLAEEALQHLAIGFQQSLSHTNNTMCMPENGTSNEISNINNIRIIGHSVGGAVAAVVSMLLEGSLSSKRLQRRSAYNSSTALLIQHQRLLLRSFITKFAAKNRVRCFTFGAPPCVSRGIVPPYVTSLAFGHDLVTRVTEDSMKRLCEELSRKMGRQKSKYLEYDTDDSRSRGITLPKKSFRLRRKKSMLTTRKGLFGAVSSIATIPKSLSSTGGVIGGTIALGARGLRQYAAGSTNDLDSLNIPGRVFYLKNSGISPSQKLPIPTLLQRVLRGSWREDTLWRLHSVIVSDSMISDHDLGVYIAALALC